MLKLLRIEGDSMYPLLKDGEKIVCISKYLSKLSIGDIVVFKYKNNPLMIKEITKINWQGIYVRGKSPDSIDSSIFGYIEKKDILYKMIYQF